MAATGDRAVRKDGRAEEQRQIVQETRRAAGGPPASQARNAVGSSNGTPAALFGIPADKVLAVWRIVEPEIRRACARSDGRYESDDVLAALLARDMQLWLAIDVAVPGKMDAVCVTQIANYPRQRRCALVFCAGHRPERWLHHLDTIGEWARAQGCVAMELQGRPGWERLLGDGWEKTHVLLRKRI